MNKYLYMTLEGIEFDRKTSRDLATWLGVLRKRKVLLDLIWSLSITVILEIVSSIFLFKYIKVFSIILPIIIGLIIFSLLDFKKFNNIKNKYFEAVKEKYEERSSKYEDFNLDIIGYKYNATSPIQSNNLLMATDKYKFIFMKDPFIDSNYKFRDGSNLKIMSENIYDNKEFIIKINDILYFRYINNDGIKIFDYYKLSFDMNSNIDLVEVVTHDYKKYVFSANFATYLRNSIPTKEKEYEE